MRTLRALRPKAFFVFLMANAFLGEPGHIPGFSRFGLIVSRLPPFRAGSCEPIFKLSSRIALRHRAYLTSHSPLAIAEGGHQDYQTQRAYFLTPTMLAVLTSLRVSTAECLAPQNDLTHQNL
jgi:hypothetical protein